MRLYDAYKRITAQEKGLVYLTGRCEETKSTLLAVLKGEYEEALLVLNAEKVTELVLALCNQGQNALQAEESIAALARYRLLCFNDLDGFEGKEATLALLEDLFCRLCLQTRVLLCARKEQITDEFFKAKQVEKIVLDAPAYRYLTIGAEKQGARIKVRKTGVFYKECALGGNIPFEDYVEYYGLLREGDRYFARGECEVALRLYEQAKRYQKAHEERVKAQMVSNRICVAILFGRREDGRAPNEKERILLKRMLGKKASVKSKTDARAAVAFLLAEELF